jgi:putative oxidoreductase
MNKLFAPRPLPGPAHLGVAVLRILAGVAMVFHGMGKLGNPEWKANFPEIQGWMLDFAAYGEVTGGALMALGLVTPLAALVLLGVMGGAIRHHFQAGDPFVGMGGSWELAGMHAAAALLVLTTGPGALSVDNLLFAKKKKRD